MPELQPDDTTELTIRDGRYVPTDAWPVAETADDWVSIIEDYNADTGTWDLDDDTSRLPTVTRDGTQYHDVSPLERGSFVRVDDDPDPIILGVTSTPDDTLTVKRYTRADALDLLERTAATPDPPESLTRPSQATDAEADTETDTDTAADTSTGTASPGSTAGQTTQPTADSVIFPWSPSDDLPRKEWALPTDAEIGDLTLGDMQQGEVVDADGNTMEEVADIPLIGFEVRYVTGSTLLVPRDELLDKFRDLGIPPKMAPDAISGTRAFKRLVDKDRLFGAGSPLEQRDEIIEGRKVMYTLMENEGETFDQAYLVTEDIPEDESDIDTSDKDVLKLGRIQYDHDTESVQLSKYPDCEGTPYEYEWTHRVAPYLEEAFERYRTHHLGKDIRDSTIGPLLRSWTDSVHLMNGVYFVPAVYGEKLDDLFTAFERLYDWLDTEHKSRGQRTRFEYDYVGNIEKTREQIQERADKKLAERIDEFYDDLYEELTSDDFAEDVVEEILDTQEDEIESLADHYSQIVEGSLSVKQQMRAKFDQLSNAKKTTIREAVDEHDLDIGIDPTTDD